jgi:catechol 2,3-dioxygenase-like lactoylglutathione lyase family enzyme
MSTTLDHVGFTVSDLDRSLAFYRDLLNMKVLWERVYEEEYVRTLVGYPTLRLRCAYLEIPGSTVSLELLEYQNVPREQVELRRADPGNAHLAISVDDLDHLCLELREAGVKFVSQPVVSTAGHYQGTKTVYVCDPDGISLQLLEIHRASDSNSEAV